MKHNCKDYQRKVEECTLSVDRNGNNRDVYERTVYECEICKYRWVIGVWKL